MRRVSTSPLLPIVRATIAVAASVAAAGGCSALIGADFGDYVEASSAAGSGGAGGTIDVASSGTTAGGDESSSSPSSSSSSSSSVGGGGGGGGSDPCARCQARDLADCPIFLTDDVLGTETKPRLFGGIDGIGEGSIVAAARSPEIIAGAAGFEVLHLIGEELFDHPTFTSAANDPVADRVRGVALTQEDGAESWIVGGWGGGDLPEALDGGELAGAQREAFLLTARGALLGGDAADSESEIYAVAARLHRVAFAGVAWSGVSELGLAAPERAVRRFFVGSTTASLEPPRVLSFEAEGLGAGPCDVLLNDPPSLDVDLGDDGAWVGGQLCGQFEAEGGSIASGDEQGFVAYLSVPLGGAPLEMGGALVLGAPKSGLEVSAIVDGGASGQGAHAFVGGSSPIGFVQGGCAVAHPGVLRDAFLLGVVQGRSMGCTLSVGFDSAGDDRIRDLAFVPGSRRLLVAGDTESAGFDLTGHEVACNEAVTGRRAFIALLTVSEDFGSATIDWVQTLGDLGVHSAAGVAIERWDAGGRRIAVAIESDGVLAFGDGDDDAFGPRVHVIRLEVP